MSMAKRLTRRTGTTAEAVALQINRAFDDVSYPGDSDLVGATDETDDERRRIIKDFSGKHWNELPLAVLRRHHASLFFFTRAAYVFYLPAYLKASVLHYDEAEMIPGSVISSLTPPKDRTGSAVVDFMAMVDSLDLAKKRAIASFLRFMLAAHGADLPAYNLGSLVDDFWARFQRAS